jgi:hypothetical protein
MLVYLETYLLLKFLFLFVLILFVSQLELNSVQDDGPFSAETCCKQKFLIYTIKVL